MATLEKKRLVLRVAYAGPPLAGKTESIRALLRLLRGSDGERYVFSPGEARGRTVFFDWAEYEAGTFRGNPIRCQITSVPGQTVLSARREALIKAADAVVLVIDSRAEGLEDARRCYEEMSPWLADAGREVPVRVILQCNKQDLEGSLSPEQLSQRLALGVAGTWATSAATGKGLRPAFIAAVREALKRAEVLTDRGLIRFDRPEIDSGQELLERMQRDVVARETAVDERPSPVAQAIAEERSRAPAGAPAPPPAPPPSRTRTPTPPPPPPTLRPTRTPTLPAPPVVREIVATPREAPTTTKVPSASPAVGEAGKRNTRPAVMPASVAPLALSLAPSPPPASLPQVPSRAFGTDTRARPAVMPATAYRVSMTAAGIAREGRPLAPARERAEVSTAVADVAPAIEQRMKAKGRPAVVPAAAFFAPRLPSQALPDEQVYPLAMWRALDPQRSVLRAVQDPRGGWHGEPAPGWYAHTIESARDYEAGRRLYDTAVNRQNDLYRYLSKERCLALTQEADGWWLWQVVRKVPTLAARLEHWPRAVDSPEGVAGALVECARNYLDALEAMKDSPEPLPLGLDKVAAQNGSFVYAGLLPRPAQEATARADRAEALEDALRSHLSPLARPSIDVPAVLNALQNKATGELPGPLVEMMCSVLIGH